jgi:hypothetical protein
MRRRRRLAGSRQLLRRDPSRLWLPCGVRRRWAEVGVELLGGEGLDDVADADVLVAGEIDTALDALADFGDVVLEALEGAILPFQTSAPSRMRRACALRLMMPSVTRQPAIWPTLVILKTLRTSARPA